jgi:mannan endo-1,4-beta-mannosidase
VTAIGGKGVRMRLALLAGLVGLALADESLIRSIKEPQIPPIYPIGAVNGSFAKVSGRLFNIDGRVAYFSGTNAWYLGHLMSNDDVDLVMKQLVDVSLPHRTSDSSRQEPHKD